jgi:hypothetical protein
LLFIIPSASQLTANPEMIIKENEHIDLFKDLLIAAMKSSRNNYSCISVIIF